jgi:hypothetical protein
MVHAGSLVLTFLKAFIDFSMNEISFKPYKNVHVKLLICAMHLRALRRLLATCQSHVRLQSLLAGPASALLGQRPALVRALACCRTLRAECWHWRVCEHQAASLQLSTLRGQISQPSLGAVAQALVGGIANGANFVQYQV